MADITLSVSTWQAQVVATDDAAVIAILEEYERAYGLDNTLPAEVRLQNMLEHLVRHVENVALGQRQREAERSAREAAETDAPGW